MSGLTFSSFFSYASSSLGLSDPRISSSNSFDDSNHAHAHGKHRDATMEMTEEEIKREIKRQREIAEGGPVEDIPVGPIKYVKPARQYLEEKKQLNKYDFLRDVPISLENIDSIPPNPLHERPWVITHVGDDEHLQRLDKSSTSEKSPDLVDGTSKYLFVSSSREGVASLPRTISELLNLAADLDRILVEPCVKNSVIVPCRCGQVVSDIPTSVQRMSSYGSEDQNPRDGKVLMSSSACLLEDTRFPALPERYEAKQDSDWLAFPLHAYMDIEFVHAKYPGRMISHEDFCAKRKPMPGMLAATYCGSPPRGRHLSPSCPQSGGDFQFSSVIPLVGSLLQDELDALINVRDEGAAEGFVPALAGAMKAQLSEDRSQVVVLSGYRAYMYPVDERIESVPFNSVHECAAKEFIAETHKGRTYFALHWDTDKINADYVSTWRCGSTIPNIVRRLMAVVPPDHNSNGAEGRFSILSDAQMGSRSMIPWYNDLQDKRNQATGTMRRIMEETASVKVDDKFPELDGGIWGIRDLYIGIFSEVYATCLGDMILDCRSCMDGTSRFDRYVIEKRKAMNKMSNTFTNIFNMIPDDLVTRLGPPQ
jgi:hypothetical protein